MKRRRVSLLFLIVALLFVAGALGWNLFGDLPTPDALITHSARDTTKIFDRNGRLLYEILDPRAGSRTRVRLSDLPLHLRQAVVAVEDANFDQNPGVDALGILRAAWQNISAGEIVAGGSTITQQLARQVLLSPEERDTRRFTRKLREAVLALEITHTYSKDQILEMYLNEVYFGQLAYGIEAAARTYFGKPARDLDLAESALLAGLIQSPSAYNPLVNLDAARARQRIALGLMVKNGLITEAQSVIAQAELLHFASASPTTTLRAPH
ncbi:partial penicillin-binding protein 1A, partial [Anaerolineae bacterium]